MRCGLPNLFGRFQDNEMVGPISGPIVRLYTLPRSEKFAILQALSWSLYGLLYFCLASWKLCARAMQLHLGFRTNKQAANGCVPRRRL